MKVGIFFKVTHELIIDAVPIEDSEPYGEAMQHGSHYDFHDILKPRTPAESRFKRHDYDYYPRGRVVYFPKQLSFVLYADPCLISDDIQNVIELFGLKESSLKIVTMNIIVVQNAISSTLYSLTQ